MKTFLILCVLSFVGLSWARKPVNPRGCIYIDGICCYSVTGGGSGAALSALYIATDAHRGEAFTYALTNVLGQSECEVGTYSYTTGCNYLTPEPTCDNPNPKPDTRGKICDYSACYCAPPTVRNQCGKCVPLDECP